MTRTILFGDCRALLPTLGERRFQTCVTSPPYWGLRDYECAGQIGLERDPRDYLDALVDVFRQVRRALRDDGTLWLNMGDSYTDSGRGDDTGSTLDGSRRNQTASRQVTVRNGAKPFGLGKKQLLMMPARLALRLQEDGWYLRAEIIWHKPNPMPESCRDRPTRAHELLYLFSKRRKYFYDRHALEELASEKSHPRKKVPSGWDTRTAASDGGAPIARDGVGRRHKGLKGRYRTRAERPSSRAREKANESFAASTGELVPYRNIRDVWTIRPVAYKGAHTATFPPKLAQQCIRAATSVRACEFCGAAWRPLYGDGWDQWKQHREVAGWRQRCDCTLASGTGRSAILDPFGGSGTVPMVAEEHGRDSTTIELNPQYIADAPERYGLRPRESGIYLLSEG